MYIFCNDKESLEWLNSTHLKGVILPTEFNSYKSFVMKGTSEDNLSELTLFNHHSPRISDDRLVITFDNNPPFYCRYSIERDSGEIKL